MPFHKAGAYDGFDSVAEAKEYYRHCRREQHFILSDVGVEADKPVCLKCGKPIADDDNGDGYRGNRGVYYPKRKKVAIQHYLCAWENLMGAILNQERLI